MAVNLVSAEWAEWADLSGAASSADAIVSGARAIRDRARAVLFHAATLRSAWRTMTASKAGNGLSRYLTMAGLAGIIDAQLAELAALVSAYDTQPAIEASPLWDAGFTSLTVNGTALTAVCAGAEDVFGGFETGDVVALSGCGSATNGTYTVATAAAQSMTFTTSASSGSVSETAAIIRLTVRA